MNLQELDADLDAVRAKAAKLIQQRDALSAQLVQIKKPAAESDLADILRAALRGETGWAERARLALGDYKMILCENCNSPFPSGGKRKKNCGNC